MRRVALASRLLGVVPLVTFPDFLRSLGIIPPEQFTPGRWQRCATDSNPRKRNASIKLNEDERSGFAQDFATMQECAVWLVTGDNGKIERTAQDIAASVERQRLRREMEIQGTMRARTAYVTSEPLRHANHPYLHRKRCDMQGCAGLKVDKEGALVIPMYREGRLVSVQRISEDGEKKFAWGAPSKAATFRIIRPGAVAQVLCEGLATGLTVFSACPMAQVIVCFSAANLIAVAEREDFTGMVAIAADNDAGTEEDSGKNPGIIAAQRAAEILGCGVAIPYCQGTDFNDMFIERLERIEKEDESEIHRAHPAKLRERALVPIRTAVMGALKKVAKRV